MKDCELPKEGIENVNELPVYIDVFLAPVRDCQEVQIALMAMLILTAADIIFGLGNAIASKTFSSAKMRDGIKHKSASFGLVLIGIVADGLVFGNVELAQQIGFDAPVLMACCVYLCVMEIASLLETFKLLNPQLAGSKVLSLFEINHKEDDDAQR